MKQKIIVLALSVAFIVGIYAYFQYNKTHEDVTNVRPDIQVTAAELYADYSSNEENANQKYLGKLLEISGQISNIEIDTASSKIYLETEDVLAEIQCEMENDVDLSTLKIGDSVTLKGFCSGYLTDVVISRSIIVQ